MTVAISVDLPEGVDEIFIVPKSNECECDSLKFIVISDVTCDLPPENDLWRLHSKINRIFSSELKIKNNS